MILSVNVSFVNCLPTNVNLHSVHRAFMLQVDETLQEIYELYKRYRDIGSIGDVEVIQVKYKINCNQLEKIF